ncbi:MAG: PAS domain-containing protein [Archangiaceae bacterium]|nr:PAS domain-containing protein [Archangiaceae bacterium]
MTLLLAIVCWLLLLFGVAQLGQTSGRFRQLSKHPLVYSLSLGVYATSWTYFGAVGFARTSGLDFLAVSLGPTLAALLVPVVSLPLLEVLRRHRLATLADLLAFRYRSKAVGAVVTFTLMLAIIPYLAVQVRGVGSTASVLLDGLDPVLSGAAFCVAMVLFASLFGASHATSRERHPGLVLAVAMETLFKLVALLVVGVTAVTTAKAPLVVPPLPQTQGFVSVTLLSVVAAFLLPRQFHMAFAEAPEGEPGRRALLTSTWAFPLVLLLLNLPIPLILAAGTQLSPEGNADLYVLTVAAQVPLLPTLAWLGGVSASSAMVIVGTLALSNMVATHWVTPLRSAPKDLYRQLVLERRFVIAASLGLAFVLFVVLERVSPAAVSRGGALAQVGLVAFAGVAQTLPATLGVFFFPKLSRAGVIAGLVVGTAAWLLSLALPLVGVSLVHLPEVDGLGVAVWCSLGLNVAAAALGSWSSPVSREESLAAEACRREVVDDDASLPVDQGGFVERLAPVLGQASAALEVAKARSALALRETDTSVTAMKRLKRQLEADLSALVGPMVSWAALNVTPREEFARGVPLAERIRSLEEAVAHARQGQTQTAAETLRAWLEAVFRALPVGVCVLGPDDDVVWWNERLATLTGVASAQVRGRLRTTLEADLAQALAASGEHRVGALTVRVTRTSAADGLEGASIVVVEDLSQTRQLEAQVRHQDRLATIGRFAAGVAHEVGNPLAAVMMLTQGIERDHDASPERLSQLYDAARRIDEIVRGLVSFARAGSIQTTTARQPVSLDAIATQAASLVQLSKNRAVTLELSSADATTDANTQELVQVVVNLLTNAVDATPNDERVRVHTSFDQHHVTLDVIDEGAGMAPEVAAHVFEPFFTTKDVGQGTGLGLSVAWTIVQAHGGTLTVKSAPGAGTTMTLQLPRSA